MIKRAASLLVFAGILLCANQARAAVFSLKNVTFTNGSDNYSISGEFKINTALESDYKLTDWRIEVFKGAASDGLFTYNSSADGQTPGDNGNGFTICTNTNANCAGGKELALTFGTNFNQVYLDPLPGNDYGAGVGNGKQLLGTTSLQTVAYTGAQNPSIPTGQADFVPFSPFLMSLAPVPLLSRSLVAKKIA